MNILKILVNQIAFIMDNITRLTDKMNIILMK